MKKDTSFANNVVITVLISYGDSLDMLAGKCRNK